MRSHQLPMNPREWILAIKPWLSSHIGPIQDGFCSTRHFGQMTTLFQSVSCPSKIWPLQCRCMQGHQLPMSLRNGAKPFRTNTGWILLHETFWSNDNIVSVCFMSLQNLATAVQVYAGSPVTNEP